MPQREGKFHFQNASDFAVTRSVKGISICYVPVEYTSLPAFLMPDQICNYERMINRLEHPALRCGTVSRSRAISLRFFQLPLNDAVDRSQFSMR